jgi:hypothetical protein
MSCSPCGHASIVTFLNEIERNSCKFRLVLERFYTRIEFVPFLGVGRLPGFDISVSGKSDIRFGILVG